MKPKLLLILLLVLIVALQVGAQNVPQEVVQTAEEGLPIFLSLISPSWMENFGFSENDNLDDAVLGRPFQEYSIYDTDVENYREEDTIYDVLTESLIWYFPVMIADESKCLLGVGKMDDNWEAVSIGNAWLAQSVALARQVWPISEGYDPLFCVKQSISTYFFTIPQVDEYNLTQLNYYPPIESEDELTQLYQDLKPLPETMAYIASEIHEDIYDNDNSDGGGGPLGCFISSAM